MDTLKFYIERLNGYLKNVIKITHLLEINLNCEIPRVIMIDDNVMIELQRQIELELKQHFNTTKIDPAIWKPFWDNTYLQWNRNNGPIEFWRFAERNIQDTIEVLTTIARPEKLSIITVNELIMGDKFQDVNNSTIYNRSTFVDAFNVIKNNHSEESAKALEFVGQLITSSANKEAGELFDSFNEELKKEQPKKSLLSSIWDGITKLVPLISETVGLVEKITPLFHH